MCSHTWYLVLFQPCNQAAGCKHVPTNVPAQTAIFLLLMLPPFWGNINGVLNIITVIITVYWNRNINQASISSSLWHAEAFDLCVVETAPQEGSAALDSVWQTGRNADEDLKNGRTYHSNSGVGDVWWMWYASSPFSAGAWLETKVWTVQPVQPSFQELTGDMLKPF